MKLRFMGANGQVTGSRYLLEAGGLRLLVDCGMFQERAFLSRNWEAPPISPGEVDYVLLTHAHLDHAGLLPRFYVQGYRRPVLATRATVELAGIVLRDAAHIQLEDVGHKRRRHEREGRRGAHPEVPLYTPEDAEAVLSLFEGVGYGDTVALNDHVSARFHEAGHILGSAMLEVVCREGDHSRRLVFSGDVGQWDRPLVRDPAVFDQADYVVVESTYGDRNHREEGSIEDQLCGVVNETVAAGGNLLIPTFAVERAQELMFYLSRLMWQNRIPHLLTFVDSPMAVDVTGVFLRHAETLDRETRQVLHSDRNPFAFPGLKLVRTVEESKAINRIRGTCIVMAGSGMCTAGRIKHHLEQHIGRPEATVLFVGYQARGTLGRQIAEGSDEVRIHGQPRRVRARVAQIHGLSAHADQEDLGRWLSHFQTPPRRIYVTHGEEEASRGLSARIGADLGWEAVVPRYLEEWQLE
ncbi:MAG: MBL fold metallo-hydrolase [Candidatus Latescibacterota bacterium]